MIRLGDFVQAVLDDMAAAQSKAAMYSAQMAADFRDHDVLRHMPVPMFRITNATVDLRFAIAEVADTPAADPAPQPGGSKLDRSSIIAAAERVAGALGRQRELAPAFGHFADGARHWVDAVVPEITLDLSKQPLETMPIDALIVTLASAVKSHYLQGLLDKKARVTKAKLEASVAAGHPEQVRSAALRLIRIELEKAQAQAQAESQPTSSAALPPRIPLPGRATLINLEGISGDGAATVKLPGRLDRGLQLLVEPAELGKTQNVSTLRLELELASFEPRMLMQAGQPEGDDRE